MVSARRWDHATDNVPPWKTVTASASKTDHVMATMQVHVRRCARGARVLKVAIGNLKASRRNAVQKVDVRLAIAKATATARNVPRRSRNNLRG